jgi:hypothetical protein
MSTIVVKSATAAENMSVGIPGAANWTNPTNAISSNNQYAINDYGGITGVSITNYLYAHTFDFNLPLNAVLEGFEVTVERRGIGSTEDYYVGLIYFDGMRQITTPGKQLPGTWPTFDANVTYGSPADLWNKVWTIAETNDSSFGFAISAEGNPIDLDSAQIDSIQITAYYHQAITEIPTGSLLGGGVAEVTCSYSTSIQGSSLAGGQVVISYDEFMTDGIELSGTSPSDVEIAVSGGVSFGGECILSSIYEDALGLLEYRFTCSGEKEIPQDLSHDEVALAVIRISSEDNKVHWDIRHTISGLDAVRFRFPVTKTEIGTGGIRLDELGPTTSPVIGSLAITSEQRSQLESGLWYLFIREDAAPIRLRGQVANGVGGLGGSALISKVKEDFGSGGISLSGGERHTVIYNIEMTGGILAGHSASIGIQPFISGGSNFSGYSDVNQVFNFDEAVVFRHSGSSDAYAEYNLENAAEAAPGGSSAIGIEPFISGGSSLGGSAVEIKLVVASMSGGAECNGLHILQQIYASQPIKNGIKAAGRSRVENIIFYEKRIQNVGHALKTPNILNAEIPKARIIDPIQSEIPELKENRFRNLHESGWCDLDESCDNGYLAPITKKIQGKYLPPKQRRQIDRNRNIARIT